MVRLNMADLTVREAEGTNPNKAEVMVVRHPHDSLLRFHKARGHKRQRKLQSWGRLEELLDAERGLMCNIVVGDDHPFWAPCQKCNQPGNVFRAVFVLMHVHQYFAPQLWG